jgi:ketosteroid isomerase-like protein
VNDPAGLVRAWFDAFERGDMDTARGLLAPDALVWVEPDSDPPRFRRGFDDLVEWYAVRRTDETFGYELEGITASAAFAIATIRLRAGAGERLRSWRQTAVYRVEDGAIRSIWLFEDPD